MDRTTTHQSSDTEFELQFRPLDFGDGALRFPCDSNGIVDLDSMPDEVRSDYFYARTLIGQRYAIPVVVLRAAWTEDDHATP